MTWSQLSIVCDLFQEGRRFRPWLYGIATHKAIDLMRKEGRRCLITSFNEPRGESSEQEGELRSISDLLISREPAALEVYERKEVQPSLRASVAQLPSNYREAVDLVYFQGLKYREAAELLGLPVGTLKSRLHSAILMLQEKFRYIF